VLNEVRRGVFVAPLALRESLQSSPDFQNLAGDAVRSAPQIEIRALRQRGILSTKFQLEDGLNLRVNFMRERRSGNRLMSQGTYSRISTAAGDRFETPGQDIWEPTAYATTEFGAELTYTRKNFLVGGSYLGSIFNNHDVSVIWQNPFQATPMQANPPDGGANRGRFAQTQTALPPDNQAHTLTANAMVLLPRSSKVSGLVSWTRMSQDEAFLPFTLNDAITAANLPAGTTPTSLAALPRASLGGVINTLNQDYAATTRPVRPVQLTFRYNDYDLKNETQPVHFPGYAGYGDSFWRTAITGQPGTTPLRIDSHTRAFRRKRALFEGALRPVDALTWKAAYQFERWNRENREVEHSSEHGFLTSVSFAPKKNFFAKGGFRYFDRTPKSYDPGTLEPAFLRMFDQAKRQRTHADALLSVNLTSSVVLSGSAFYVADSYDKSFFGLHQQKTGSVNADLTVNPNENIGLVFGWGYDRSGYDYLQVAKTTFPYSFANTWSRDTRERANFAHVGISGAFAEGKGQYQLNYQMALARTEVNTVNPNAIVANQALNAQAYPFPLVKNQLHEFRFDASYEVSRRVRVGVNWFLEPYRLNDFANDVVQAYGPGSIAPENDARRFLFLDNGPSNYTGNLAAVYLRFSLF
jgi:MtrB/PioB family decaheme-associated outer membrane protein